MMKKDVCLHFDGLERIRGNNTGCKKGHNPSDFGNPLVCLKNGSDCVDFCGPTDEQIKQHEKETEEYIKQFIKKARPLIKELKEAYPNGGIGNTDCPICNNKLHFSVSSYNGHCHGKCETEGCLNWME